MHLTPWHDNFGFHGRVIAESKFHIHCPDDYERFLNCHGWSRTQLYDFKDPDYIRNLTSLQSKLPQELHIDAFVGRSICAYLQQVAEPFCLFASFLSPHNPYDPPTPYYELYRDREVPRVNITEGEVERKPKEAYDYINNRLRWPFKTDQLTRDQLQTQYSAYLATCTLIDDWVGRILDVLMERNLYENTVIVYTSDHGDLLGDHGLIYKQSFYEQSVRVPLIVHAPSRFPARRVGDLIESIDLFSTICDLGETWTGHGVQGRTLVPLLEAQPNYSHRRAAFSENYFGRMVRYREFKMVYYPGKPYGELYNLQEDPDEQRNLWDALEGSALKRELKDLLLDWAFMSEDAMPLPVRPDHQDMSPRETVLHQGGTREAERQPWYLPELLPLYKGWEFGESGILRE
jgi:arylsulfatase A-like enzyme